MDRPKPTKRQQEQWDELVKDLPVYNPCPKCRKLQSDLRKVVDKARHMEAACSWGAVARVHGQYADEIEKLLGGE